MRQPGRQVTSVRRATRQTQGVQRVVSHQNEVPSSTDLVTSPMKRVSKAIDHKMPGILDQHAGLFSDLF